MIKYVANQMRLQMLMLHGCNMTEVQHIVFKNSLRGVGRRLVSFVYVLVCMNDFSSKLA